MATTHIKPLYERGNTLIMPSIQSPLVSNTGFLRFKSIKFNLACIPIPVCVCVCVCACVCVCVCVCVWVGGRGLSDSCHKERQQERLSCAAAPRTCVMRLSVCGAGVRVCRGCTCVMLLSVCNAVVRVWCWRTCVMLLIVKVKISVFRST